MQNGLITSIGSLKLREFGKLNPENGIGIVLYQLEYNPTIIFNANSVTIYKNEFLGFFVSKSDVNKVCKSLYKSQL